MPNNSPSKYISLPGHIHIVRAVGAPADGSIIATGSYDATICIWDPITGKGLGRIDTNSDIGALAVSSDGTKVVIGCKSNFVEVWEIQSGKCICQMQGHKAFPCSSISYSNDGKWIASASWEEPGIFLWDLKTCKLKQHIIPRDSIYNNAVSVAFSIHGTRVAIGASDGLFIYELPSIRPIAKFKIESLPRSRINFIRFLDDDTIASINASGAVEIRSISEKMILKYKRFEFNETAFAGALSDDGRRVVLGGCFGNLSEWDFDTGYSLVEKANFHNDNQIMALMYVPGTYIWVSGDSSGAVKLWNSAHDIHTAEVSTLMKNDRIQKLEEALKQRPDWANGHDQLAREYLERGDIVNTFKQFYFAAQIEPESNQPHKYLKEIYLSLGLYNDYVHEDEIDKCTDNPSIPGGTRLLEDICYKLQRMAMEHRKELEEVIRKLKS